MYREFHNEELYRAPSYEVLPNTLSVLQHLHNQKAQQGIIAKKKAEQDLEDIRKFHANTTVPKYDRMLGDLASGVTQRAQNDIMRSGTISPETKMQMQHAVNLNQRGIAIREERKRLMDEENAKRQSDKYYNANPNIDFLNQGIVDSGLTNEEELAKDEQNLTQFRTRNPLENVAQTFKADEQRADYITDLKNKQIETSFKGKEGGKTKRSAISPFLDEKGMPNVTNEHVLDYYNSHPSIKPYYQERAVNQILKEIDENKAADPEWGQGLSKNQILTGLLTPEGEPGHLDNPNPNAKNQNGKAMTLAERQMDMARNDLKRQANFHLVNDVDYSDVSSGAGWGIKNKNIETADGWNEGNYSGPSRTIVRTNSTTSPYLTLQSKTPIRVNVDTGKVTANETPKPFTLRNYSWGLKTNNGGVFNIEASNLQEYKKKLSELPDSAFDAANPNGIKESSIVFNGQSIDKKQVLDLGFDKMHEIEKELSIKDDPEKRKLYDNLGQQLEKVSLGQEYNAQFLQSQIGDVVHNEKFAVSPTDENVQSVEAQTGMNPYSQKAQNKEMLEYKRANDEEIKKRREQATGKKSFKTEGYKKNIAAIKNKQAKEPKKETAQVPKEGDVIDGYRFMGGDPAKQENWQKL